MVTKSSAKQSAATKPAAKPAGKANVTQHPMEIPAGESTKNREFLITKPVGSELKTFNATTASGEPSRRGRINAYDVKTGQIVNYMTGTNSKGDPIGRHGEISGVEQSEDFINAVNDALNSNKAITYDPNGEGHGVRAIIVVGNLDLASNPKKSDVPHIVNDVRNGLTVKTPTEEQVRACYSNGAKYKYAETLAGKTYNEYRKNHTTKSTKGAHTAASTAKAQYLAKARLPFINLKSAEPSIQKAYEDAKPQTPPAKGETKAKAAPKAAPKAAKATAKKAPKANVASKVAKKAPQAKAAAAEPEL